MRRKIKSACLLIVSASFFLTAAPRMAAQYPLPGPDRVYAIKAGKLVDPEKGTTETNQIILVRGKKLRRLAPTYKSPRTLKSSTSPNRRCFQVCSTRIRICA